MDVSNIANSQFLLAMLTMIAVAGTVFVIVMPIFERNALKHRMKSVALERDRLRAKERARLATEKGDARASLRMQSGGQNIRSIVDRFNLRSMLADENTQNRLRMAGYRGTAPVYTFVFARVVMPIILFLVALFYCYVILADALNPALQLLIPATVAALGFFVPNIYVQNAIDKRQLVIRRAWPDALDLMLICVESGMSIEAAFQRVAEEIGIQSIPLAEEMSLTTAELSYLGERRKAYENLANRTGLEGVKNVMMALIQAERYGTPVASALRVMADENRQQRMQEAEKKAASLPPKLTVPMIVFFLPVLFFVIMGPAVMQVSASF
ncbi:type II secretion system protein [Roseibium aquae]|uniref:Type II secretion system protein n=1 Tax=Roseibium aquae TaxID=1323746 RepID=A0A916TPB9_9HYPH|nr:type II secretion system protein [Roseibium aquae]